MQFYLIFLRGIRKQCKYDEIHWNMNELKRLPLWKHSLLDVWICLFFQRTLLPKSWSVHTHTQTHTAAINTHTYRRKMKFLQFPFAGPLERYQRNILTFLVIISGYAQKELLTVVLWLDSKLYSAYLKKVLSGEKVILHSLSRDPGTCWRQSGCSALPQKWLHFRGEGIIPFVQLLPVDVHSWGNQTLKLQAGKCFGTFQSRKTDFKIKSKEGKEIGKMRNW